MKTDPKESPRSPSVFAPAGVMARLLSFAGGAAVALMFYYLLYRVGLPSRPFIYVAF